MALSSVSGWLLLSQCPYLTSARVMANMRRNGVVPIGQDRARLESHPRLVRWRPSPSRAILVRIQDRPAMETRGRPRSAHVLEHRLVADQRFAGPIAADQAEHSVLDRVPLARSR